MAGERAEEVDFLDVFFVGIFGTSYEMRLRREQNEVRMRYSEWKVRKGRERAEWKNEVNGIHGLQVEKRSTRDLTLSRQA
jgi:hypothetical protein